MSSILFSPLGKTDLREIDDGTALKAAAKKMGEKLPPWDSYDLLNTEIIYRLEL